VYCSTEAHSSVDKAVILLGLGHESLRHIATDDQYRMRADLLRETIDRDVADGMRPVAVVATAGTTSSTSVDPIDDIARICADRGIWLHVDAAYAGVTAMLPDRRERFSGWERADSIVVNPHKWLFVPFDLSAFYCRRMDVVRSAFSIVPEYLRTSELSLNLMDTGIQLGRRFRALKLWMVLRHFGARGIRAALAEHMRLATTFAGWVDAHPDFERLAAVPFSVVCFRASPPALALSDQEMDVFNEELLDRVNATGEVFLSHTRLNGRLALRVAIGHLSTTEAHIRRAWELLTTHTVALTASRHS
jgi:aromatic-L-amino-acid decarboxylase